MNCNCADCLNLPQFEAYRTRAIQSILERNPSAFRPKVAALRNGKHGGGCACRRSNCLKRYCECFQAGVQCSEHCRCIECRNFEGFAEGASLVVPKITLDEQYREFLEQALFNCEAVQEADELCCNEEVIATEGVMNSPKKSYTFSAAYEAQEANLYLQLIDRIKEMINK